MEYVLKSSVLVLLFYICYKLFLQKETFFDVNRWYLLLGIIIASFLPSVIIPIYIYKETPEITSIVNESISVNSLTNESIFTFNYLLLIIYLIGVSILALKLVFQLWSLYRIILSGTKEKSENYNLIKTEENSTPFSFFNWIVYNPNEYSKKELEQILTHEKVHANQLHSIDVLLAQIATILLWFNPFIWLYKRDLEQNLEYIADNKTQDLVSCKKTYQTLLLRSSVTNYQVALVNNFFNSKIKKRIVMLHKNKSNNRNALKIVLVLPLLAAFLMSFNTKEIITYSDNQKQFNSEQVEIIEVLITKDYTKVDFEDVKKQFEEYGIILKFKGVKRNNKNEIIAIKIDYKSKEGASGNTNINGSNPILPIRIYHNTKDGEISIGSTNEFHVSGGGNTHHKVKKLHFKSNDHSKEHENVFIISTDENGEHKANHESEHNIIIVKGDSLINKKSDGENIFFIKSDGDNKEVSKKMIFHVKEGEGEHEILELKNEDGNKNGIFIIKKTEDGNISKKWIEGKDENIWVEKNGDKIIVKEVKDSLKTKVIKIEESPNKKIQIRTTDGKTPLIIIDGKESSRSKLDNLDPDAIESMNVLKGDAAVKKYGEKAKEGVIEITTKK